MRSQLFTGVCTALVTPFQEDNIDLRMLQKLLTRQMEAGIHAVVIAGTTGEASTLTDEEKITLFRKSKEFAGKDCLIIAGTGTNNTAHSAALSIEAEKAGADAVLVVSPYYNKANPEGIYRHYRSIAECISIPLIVYNVPSRTGLDIPVSVYQRLSEIPNIVGVKEANPDITRITKIINACGEQFSVWTGNDDQIVPAMSLGAQGVISVVSNVKPATTLRLCKAAQIGDYKTASELQRSLQALIDALFCEVNPIPVKAAMKQIGLPCGQCRLPLCDISPEGLSRLQSALS